MSPTAIEHIMAIISKNRFKIVEKKKLWLSKEVVGEFYKEHQGQSFFESLKTYLSS
jgi:nucleoside diphosphate kinase